jgi:DNA mismatch endonuclease (patch repair protein)
MGDNLTKAQRSRCMSQVRNKGTNLERLVERALRRSAIRYRKNCALLPGSPDFVLPALRTAVFVDGDFWHGYRFPSWEADVSSFWQVKITRNRARDKSSHSALRRLGWRVVRLWQHEIERDLGKCVAKILSAPARNEECRHERVAS